MANTYTALYYHIVFSTKNREFWITPDKEQRIWEYMGGIARNNGMTAIKIGGYDNHVHVLLSIPSNVAISRAVQLIKGISSRWIHQTDKDMLGFSWQDGYGAFTIGLSQLPNTIRYIESQRQHHLTKPFETEFTDFIHKHGIKIDEDYLLG